MKPPFIIGLTGGIAMGKSETAKMFEAEGVPVFDADACVHDLYGKDRDLQAKIELAFPGSVQNDAVNRTELSRQLQNNPDGFARLNAIVHPAVQNARESWLVEQGKAGHDMVVFDIPLLFETGGETKVDASVVVHASANVQRQRAMARPGMSTTKLQQILSRQMKPAQKRKLADYVICTDEGLTAARLQVTAVLRHIRETRIN